MIQKSVSIYDPVLRISIIIDYIFLSSFFFLLFKNELSKKFLILGVFLFVSFNFISFFTSQGNISIVVVVEFVLLIICAVYYLFEKIKVVGSVPIYLSISFWLVVGILIFSSGNIFAFVYWESMAQNIETAKQIKIVYYVVTFSKNIVFTLALIFGNEGVTRENSFTIPEDINLDDFSIPKNDNPTS